MSLPKIELPIFTATIPSTKQKVKLRPMLVKEEKILLMAKESQESNSIMLAVKQIVNNCLVNGDIDVNKLAMFDIDYLFVKIRANSVDSKIKLSYTDDEDEPLKDRHGEVRKDDDGNPVYPVYNIEVDLNEIEVKFPENQNNIISMGKDSGLKLKYPDASVYESEKVEKATTAEEIVEELILNSFDSYFEGSKVYNFKDSTREEVSEFVDNLSLGVYDKVLSFFNDLPTVHHEVKFSNSKGKERVIVLNKLTDFFII